jgi:hypothetical protein
MGLTCHARRYLLSAYTSDKHILTLKYIYIFVCVCVCVCLYTRFLDWRYVVYISLCACKSSSSMHLLKKKKK